MTSRETVYQALFAKVMPLLGDPFATVSREVIEVQRVPPGEQPVLFMDEALEEYPDDGTGLVHNRWTVYFHVGCVTSKGTPASTVLNPLLDALETALAPTDGNLLGLGDIITKAQLTGLSVKNLGNNSLAPDQRQAVAYVPFQLNFGPY